MTGQIGWKNRLMLLLLVILVGVLSALLAFYIFLNWLPVNYVNNSSHIEKITEKQVYLENSARIDTVNKVAKSLVTAIEESKLNDLLKLNGDFRLNCFEINNNGCGVNGVILTGDGLSLFPLIDFGADKPWVVINNEGIVYDLVLVNKYEERGLVLAKIVKRGEKNLAADLQTKYFNFKPIGFSELKNLTIGQEILMLKNNFFVNSANVKGNLISSIFSQTAIKNGQVAFDADQVPGRLKFSDNELSVGMVLADLGGQMIEFVGHGEYGQSMLIEAAQVEALLKDLDLKKNSRNLQWGLVYSLNNKDKQQAANLLVDYGAIVETVKDIGIAKTLGLKTGDLILEVNGQSLLENNLSDLLEGKNISGKLQITILRNDKKEALIANL